MTHQLSTEGKDGGGHFCPLDVERGLGLDTVKGSVSCWGLACCEMTRGEGGRLVWAWPEASKGGGGLSPLLFPSPPSLSVSRGQGWPNLEQGAHEEEEEEGGGAPDGSCRGNPSPFPPLFAKPLVGGRGGPSGAEEAPRLLVCRAGAQRGREAGGREGKPSLGYSSSLGSPWMAAVARPFLGSPGAPGIPPSSPTPLPAASRPACSLCSVWGGSGGRPGVMAGGGALPGEGAGGGSR